MGLQKILLDLSEMVPADLISSYCGAWELRFGPARSRDELLIGVGI